jgi:AraC family transcriptional regulator, transcriptional activator of pobA
MPDRNAIPRFFLYGDAKREVERDFLHIERIRIRSSQHDWTIRPHAHPNHSQLLLVTEGGGTIQVEAETWRTEAPCLLVIPATAVHAITFVPGTDGFVVTAAASFLDVAIGPDKDIGAAAKAARHYTLTHAEIEEHGLLDAFHRLDREFVWSAPGRRTAVTAHLQRILVALARLAQAQRRETSAEPRRDADLVLRYRELIELHFRSGLPLAFYAGKLGVTHSRLNAVCRSVMGESALKLLHARQMIEAQRNLLYTSMSVAEVAYAVGFEDPAYFSRFFSARAGMPPGRYRDAEQGRQSVTNARRKRNQPTTEASIP